MSKTQGTAKRVMLLSITIKDIQRAADTASISYDTLMVALKALDELGGRGDGLKDRS